MTSSRSATIVFGLVITLMTAALAWREEASTTLPTALERKLESADRVLVYVVDAATGPRFRMVGGERELKLITHVLLARGTAYDPRRVVAYGFHASLHSPDGELFWERDIFSTSRQSKQDRLGDRWLHENSFTLDAADQITDDRLLRVTLPPAVPVGSVFTLTYLGPPRTRGLVRAYRRVERGATEQRIRAFALDDNERRALVDHLTVAPWERLTETQRLRRLQHGWERMSAEGLRGSGFELMPVFVADFRLPAPAEHDSRAARVWPERHAAVNVMGPARVELRAHVWDTGTRVAEQPPLEVTQLDANGALARTQLSLPNDGASARWLELLDGAHTLTFATRNPAGAEVAVLSTALEPRASVLREQPDPRRWVSAGVEQLRPEFRHTRGYALGPERTPVAIELVGDNDASRVLRLDLRWFGHDSEHEHVVAHMRMKDASGRIVSERALALPAAPDAFDAVRPLSAVAAEPTSEVVSLRFIAPRRATMLELSSDADVAVLPQVYLPPREKPNPIHPPPYGEVELHGVHWRAAPLAAHTWHPIAANNHSELFSEGSVALFEHQVRLEPDGDGDGVGAGAQSWVTLDPLGSRERQQVLEPASAQESFAGAWTVLRPKAPQRIHADRALGPLRVRHLVEGRLSDAPEAFEVKIDGRRRSVPIRTRTATHDLGHLDASHHVVSYGPEAEGLTLLVDRPTLPPGPVLGTRTLHRLGRRGLMVPVTKPAGITYVNIRVYRRRGERGPVRLALEVDGGAPRRRAGQWFEQFTHERREWQLSSAEANPTELIFLDSGGSGAYRRFDYVVPLGDDLHRGRHRIRIRVLQGDDVWVRFFQQGERDAELTRVVERSSTATAKENSR